MNLKNTSISDGKYKFEFEAQYPEENLLKRATLSVKRVEARTNVYHSALLETNKVQEYIVSHVRDLCVYIADKEHRALFVKIMEFIVKVEEFPINVKSVVYPGSSMILLEYGVLGIKDEAVKSIELAVLEGISNIEYHEEPLEMPEEEPEEEPEEMEDPFPLGGVTGDFVEDERFSLGVVEEGENEDD